MNTLPAINQRAVQAHIDARITLVDALNFIVEKYELVRTDRPEFTLRELSPFITVIDILRTRKVTGLGTRNGYRR